MTKRATREEFIERAKRKYGDRYDYSLVNYKNCETPVRIICKIHGEFLQKPSIHLIAKCGCFKCAGRHVINTEEFIKRAKKIHGNNYDYSLVEYFNAEKKIKIICKTHGVFMQTPHSHTSLKRGCPKCKSKKKNSEKFILEAKNIHGNTYDYSLVEYKNSRNKVKIICQKHGEFAQEANSHLKGNGCPLCSGRYKTEEKFVFEAKNIHENKYDYSLVEYKNNKEKVKILCKEHGFFYQTPSNHLKGNGCPHCKKSKGENKIKNFLIKHNIIFEPQKKFEKCKNKRLLPFDFFLPELNTCIEYDGEYHYKPIGGEKSLILTKIRDKIKTKFCKDSGIVLIRIRYDENILVTLEKKLFLKKQN